MNNLVYASTSSYVAAAFAVALHACMSTTALMATNGLETGMYTSTIAATFLALTYHRHNLAVALAGVAVLLHPDGSLLAVIVWCVVSVRCRCLPWKEILLTTLVVAPYAVFAVAYYGTVVPQTVVAKSFINHAAIDQWTFFCGKFFFSRPEAWLLGVTCLIGVGVAFRRRSDLIPIFVWGGAYVAAFSSFAMWWPWYLPPAMIAYSIASGVGLATVVLWAVTWLGKPHQERAIGLYAAAGLLVLLLVQTAKYAYQGHEAKELYMNQRRNIANWINFHKLVVSSASPYLYADRPLVVDLDGTLFKADSGFESLLHCLTKTPSFLLSLLKALIRGRHHLKAVLATHSQIDLKKIPISKEVLQFIENHKRTGRKTIIATGDNERFANEILRMDPILE